MLRHLSHLLLALALTVATHGQKAGEEITFPPESFKKLDTFEALNIEDADKLYSKGDFTGAFAAYKAFSFEFPKSQATPYVLMRMGRCLHQLEKRNAAIKAYQDVVDYFPDNVRYAAAALFYIGQCHGQNGDQDKQTAVWARMVKDDAYVQQPNSGTALTFLGGAMETLGKFEEAATYHWRTAVAFLNSNPQAAADARRKVIDHYAVRQPSHEKLAGFYTAASGFDGRGRIKDKPDDDPDYWTTAIVAAIRSQDETQRANACAYWTAKLGSRFAENDPLRKLWCDAMLAHDKQPKLWRERMEKQFTTKPATTERLIQWCRYYNEDKGLQAAFFETHAPPVVKALDRDQRIQLAREMVNHPLRMADQAHAILRGTDTRGMDEKQLLAFIHLIADFEPEEGVLRYISRLSDPLSQSKARYDYYKARSHRNPPIMEKALAEIPTLRKSTDYAGAALSWDEATLLHGLGRHPEAIKAYRSANKQPESTWEIANCLVAMKQFPEAIKTIRELESVGGRTASQACLRIAEIHRSAGDKAREVDQLRLVLKRYPKSPESSEAHRRLESYGAALTGGEAEAEE